MKLGVMVYMNVEELDVEFGKLREMGFDSCQLCCWQDERFTEENAKRVREAMERHSIDVSALWCGWDGPCEWNLVQGPVTIGLVPAAYRHQRLNTLLKGSDFARLLGVTDIVTHVGFIPNNPADPDYTGLVGALRHLAKRCAQNGQFFLFETGQEAPVTLLRTLEDIGADNVGINLDPANLLMYGLGNPIDAIDVFGPYIRNVHAKDGVSPSDGRTLGAEMPIGEGAVDFPRLIAKLQDIGYDRYLTIEREISGEQQIRDIIDSKAKLEQWLTKD